MPGNLGAFYAKSVITENIRLIFPKQLQYHSAVKIFKDRFIKNAF